MGLCHYHDVDGDERGWRLEEPDITCRCCRAHKPSLFTVEELRTYNDDLRTYVHFRRAGLGFPEDVLAEIDHTLEDGEIATLAAKVNDRYQGSYGAFSYSQTFCGEPSDYVYMNNTSYI